MQKRNALMLLVALFAMGPTAVAAPPRVTHERYKLKRIAVEPEIVTPVGMAFDRQARLLVIESHTHQDAPDYKGPERDRIRMLADSDGDGRLDRWSTFAEGFRHAMNLLVRGDSAVYVVTRGSVVLLRDTDNDGVADKQEELLRLETEDDYPHNALGGIDQAPDGSLVIGLGENHGLPFRLVGSDGKVISATGGLDGFFRCTADGKNIEHIARGVWNPFSLCVVPDGRIFAVDNDPDASPPCRLLHVVEGGDYGYLYQYGRAGTHPLQAWDGELPGTLPMVCGVGEAPTAIVDHAGSLWVTSWGDHRIERYRLVPRGASYGAEREVVVQGDADFRPTGMAIAPDGSMFFGDWVLRDYPVHGHGRIWRLELPADERKASFPPQSETDKAVSSFRYSIGDLYDRAGDPFAAAAIAFAFSKRDDLATLGRARMVQQAGPTLSTNREPDKFIGEIQPGPVTRLLKLMAWRLRGTKRAESILREALEDDSPDVRLFALRWIGDERITALRDDVAKLLDGPQPSAGYYLGALAAVDWLDRDPEMRGRDIADELLVRELSNEQRSPEAHTLALAILSPDNKFLSAERLQTYLQSGHLPLRLEAVRSLAQSSNAERFEPLATIASDEAQDATLRAEAIVGLTPVADRYQDLLERLADGGNQTVAAEAQRVLRLSGIRPAPLEEKPAANELAAWVKLIEVPGDAESGRRFFFSLAGPRCAVCHQHSGRGGRVGPDLTGIAKSNTLERLVASILQPNEEIAPHYQPWLLMTNDGKTHEGLRLPEGGDDGTEEYIDSAGVRFKIPSESIEIREATTTSIMPSGSETGMSVDDLRDLVTFLMTAETN